MQNKRLVGALAGLLSFAVPTLLSVVADSMNKDKEIEEISERVVQKMREEESKNVVSKEETV